MSKLDQGKHVQLSCDDLNHPVPRQLDSLAINLPKRSNFKSTGVQLPDVHMENDQIHIFISSPCDILIYVDKIYRKMIFGNDQILSKMKIYYLLKMIRFMILGKNNISSKKKKLFSHLNTLKSTHLACAGEQRRPCDMSPCLNGQSTGICVLPGTGLSRVSSWHPRCGSHTWWWQKHVSFL